MPCETCNAAVVITDSSEHTGEGRFKERYECANGHTGTISGREEDAPSQWSKYGQVFDA